MSVAVGYLLPAATPGGRGVTEFARAAEAAGVDSLWVSDHVLMPARIDSHYPFAADGRATWSTDSAWSDVLVVLGWVAAVTDRVRLGTAVLVAPLRQPVVFAKQWATLDALAGGRTELGIGVGWLGEEFEALGVPFRRRGALADEWIDLVRACWTGRPGPVAGEWPLPFPVITKPTPVGDVPMLVGGTSPRALARAARLGGWMAHEALDTFDLDGVAADARRLRELAPQARVVLRLVRSTRVHHARPTLLAELAAAGVDEVILDPPAGDALAEAVGILRIPDHPDQEPA